MSEPTMTKGTPPTTSPSQPPSHTLSPSQTKTPSKSQKQSSSSSSSSSSSPSRPPPKHSLKSIMFSFLKTGAKPPAPDLFPTTNPSTDGEECLHDCATCTVRYPAKFDVEETDAIYGAVKAWETHLVVATGKKDWVRDVEDEKGSVMQAIGQAGGGKKGMKLSASDMPTPDGTVDYEQPTEAMLLPSFTLISGLEPKNVPLLLDTLIPLATTSTTPLKDTKPLPQTITDPKGGVMPPLYTKPSPHAVVIYLCSQRTRDARCGQSAPLLKKELERHLRTYGLYRDGHDEREGGVQVRFISHVGGHKYSANVIIYRRHDPFGLDQKARAEEGAVVSSSSNGGTENGDGGQPNGGQDKDVGAGQCIWLARIRPEDCENLVRYTVRMGKVVKPERQLRGGFDRGTGKTSW